MPRSRRRSPSGRPDHSGTNNHEAGVDEPDLVKTDGRRIVTRRATARCGWSTPPPARVTGSLVLADNAVDADLLLAGDHALVLATCSAGDRALVLGSGRRLPDATGVHRRGDCSLVDLSGAPRLVSTYRIDGALVDARQVGSTARVVLRSASHGCSSRLDDERHGRGPDRRQPAGRSTRRRSSSGCRSTTVDAGGKRTTGRVDCDAVSLPDTYSASSLLTVLSLRPGGATPRHRRPDQPGRPTATPCTRTRPACTSRPTTAGAPCATFRGGGAPMPPRQRTAVYKFDISGTARPRYVAGGDACPAG